MNIFFWQNMNIIIDKHLNVMPEQIDFTLEKMINFGAI